MLPVPEKFLVGKAGRAAQYVVGTVVDPLVAVARSPVVTFCRVVENDVQDHFHARIVQRANHLAKLVVRLVVRRSIGVMRSEEIQRHVTPVVSFLRVILVHRHEFDGGDSQFLEVRNLLDHTAVRPPLFRLYTAVVAPRESADMHLVNDQVVLVERNLLISPVKCRLVFVQHA